MKKKRKCCYLNDVYIEKDVDNRKHPHHEFAIDPETGDQYYIGEDWDAYVAQHSGECSDLVVNNTTKN